MSRRLPRPLLVVLLIAQHSVVTLLGVSLHSLPGCGHPASVARSVEEGQASADQIRPFDPQVAAPHGCAICDHLAQIPVVTAVALCPSGLLVVSHLPDACAALPTLAARLTAQPRAPPRSHPA